MTLTEQELLARGHTLAEKVGYRETLKAAKAAANKKAQDEIDEVDAEIARIAETIRQGYENRSQLDLFVGDGKVPPSSAATTLAKLAEWHPFVPKADNATECGFEGCTAARDAKVHETPVPTEPHTWVPDGRGEGTCYACGSGKDDPVHRLEELAKDLEAVMPPLPRDPAFDFPDDEPAPAVIATHPAVERQE